MSDDVAAAMAALRAQYRDALPGKVDAIARAVTSRDPAAEGLAHRLAGSAGSYGFAAAGDAARAVEDALAAGDDAAARAALDALRAAVRADR